MSVTPAGTLPRWQELWTEGWVKNSYKKSLPIVHSFYSCLSSGARWKWIILFLAFWCITFHTTIFCFFTKAILSADWGYLAAVAKISDPVGCTESRISNFSFQQYVSILLLVHSVFVPESNCCSLYPSLHLTLRLWKKPLFADSQHCWGKICTCLYVAELNEVINVGVIVIIQTSLHLPWKENKPWHDDQPFLFI